MRNQSMHWARRPLAERTRQRQGACCEGCSVGAREEERERGLRFVCFFLSPSRLERDE